MTVLEKQYDYWITNSPEFQENLAYLSDLPSSDEWSTHNTNQLVCDAALVRILYQMYQAGDSSRLDEISDPLANLIEIFQTEPDISCVVKILTGSDSFSALSAHTWKKAKHSFSNSCDMEQIIEFFYILIDSLFQTYPSNENTLMALDIAHDLITEICNNDSFPENIREQEELYLLEICYFVIKSSFPVHVSKYETECSYFCRLTLKYDKKLKDHPVLNYKNALSYQAVLYIKTGRYKQAEHNLLQAMELKNNYPNPYIDYTIYQNISYLYSLFPYQEHTRQQAQCIQFLIDQIRNRSYPEDIDPIILAQTILNCSACYMNDMDFQTAYEVLIHPNLNYILDLKYGWRAAIKLYPAAIVHRVSSGKPLSAEEKFSFKQQLKQICPYLVAPDIQLIDVLYFEFAEAMLAFTDGKISIIDAFCNKLSDLSDEDRHENLPQVIGIYNKIAVCYYLLHETSKAIALLNEALLSSCQYIQRLFCFHQINELYGYLKLARISFCELYAILRETGSEKDCFNLLLNHSNMEESIIRKCLHENTNTELDSLQKQIFDLQDRLSELSIWKSDNPHRQIILSELQTLETRYDSLNQKKTFAFSDFTLEDIAQAMPDFSVFLNFIAVPENNLEKEMNWTKLSCKEKGEKLVALDIYCIVKGNGTFRFFRKQELHFDCNSIMDAASSIRKKLSEPGQQVSARKISNLSKTLLGSFEPYLLQNKKIFLATDGDLNDLPFSVLPLTDGRLLGEVCCITHVSSGRSFLHHSRKRQKTIQEYTPAADYSTYSSGRYFIAGNPEYTTDNKPDENTTSRLNTEIGLKIPFGDKFRPASAQKNTVSLKRLPFSAAEAEIIADKLNTNAWCNSKATKQALKSHLHAEIIHISTHGFSDKFDDNMTDDNWLTHGIAMAGADHYLQHKTGNGCADNGILTADEITRFDLSNTELFVLSACSSGLGDVGQNRENVGLRTALEIADAKYVVSTLWDVEDFACCLFMIHFYTGIVEKHMSPPTALQISQQFMKKASLADWKSFLMNQHLKTKHLMQFMINLQVVAKTRPIPFENPHYWAPYTCQQNRF